MSKYKSKNGLSPHGPIKVNWYKVDWFVDMNLGTRMFGATSSATELGLGLNGNVGVGYLFSEKFGLKGRYDFSDFKFTPGIGSATEARGNMNSFSLEAVTDLITLFTGSAPSRWRLVLHVGLGYSTFSNKSFKQEQLNDNPDYFNDPVIKGNDDMGHILLGITPQYHINSRLSINLDFSTFVLLKQDFTFDNYNGKRIDGIGNVSTLSLGITFRP
jgi:hypothetical protein